MEEPTKAIDVFGIKPLSESVHTLTQGAVDGASAFLSRICLPAAEELGLMLRDRVSAWRAANALEITQRAEQLVQQLPDAEAKHAHPRIVAGVIELGSWSDAEEVREMWAGLLASSCTDDGRDDSNLMFIDLLARLSLSQARLLDHACQHCAKHITAAGWMMASNQFYIPLEQLQELSGVSDFQRLDRELDHLRSLGLFTEAGGFSPDSTTADISPSPLALQMYARCHGHPGDPISFYNLPAQPLPAEEQV